MHKARALSTKMNNYMVDDHCYSFAWIKRSWTFGDSYFSFQKQMYLQLSPHCPKMNKKINVGISKKIQDFSPGLATKARETMVAKGRDTFISQFCGVHISQLSNSLILRQFCSLNHFDFMFLSNTQPNSLAMLL